MLLDSEYRVVGALVGRPRGDEWEAVHDNAMVTLEWAKKEMRFKKDDAEVSSRRGRYQSVAHGLSFGGGQDVSHTAMQVAGVLNAASFRNLNSSDISRR